MCSLSEQTKNLPVWFVRFHSLGGLWIGELMNQREKFRSWWIKSFSLLSPPYPQCLEHTHSNASCLIVPELLGHIVRHGDHLSRKNFYHFVLYTIKVLGLVKVKCHILSLDIVLLTVTRMSSVFPHIFCFEAAWGICTLIDIQTVSYQSRQKLFKIFYNLFYSNCSHSLSLTIRSLVPTQWRLPPSK